MARHPPDPLRLTLAFVAAVTALRLFALFATPLELYPDEAQYWLWSRELAWGYFSKPPMVAWLIAISTGLGGDGEAWIRLPAALAHAGAALALFGAGATLHDRWTGFWAAVIYSLMPGVQLSAGVMTTDAPLLLFLSLAVWGYALLLRSDRRRMGAAATFGAALGLAFLSKYAALYLLGGAALHAAVAREARLLWTPRALAAASAGFCALALPNLIWNARNGFSTVAHTAENANWAEADRFNPGELFGFLSAQLGVFGPLPFVLLLIAPVALAARGRLSRDDLALLCLALPPLLVVAVQAFISRANANWAVAAYAPGSVLAAAWLVRWRARGLLGATVVLQGGLALVFLAAVVSPALTTRLGLDNGAKRARGWAEMSRALEARAASGGWTAVTTDDRFLFNALAYYARDFWARPGAPPLRMWVREASPQNQAEAEAPLTPALAGRVLHASLTPAYRPEAARDFVLWRP
ncbi:MAG: glycosyltransferase family 39 protein, partial [Pseudomonadota bacterium]|nr:glycosyltransferase family 39 protein [Pseudomonadota bacterium]